MRAIVNVRLLIHISSIKKGLSMVILMIIKEKA